MVFDPQRLVKAALKNDEIGRVIQPCVQNNITPIHRYSSLAIELCQMQDAYLLRHHHQFNAQHNRSLDGVEVRVGPFEWKNLFF